MKSTSEGNAKTPPKPASVAAAVRARERRKPAGKKAALPEIPMERNAMAYNVVRRVNDESVLLGRIGPAPIREGEKSTRRKVAYLFNGDLWTELGEFEDHLAALNAITAKHPRKP